MNKSSHLVVGEQYSRKDLFSILEVPDQQTGGNWFTGYTQYQNEYYAFVNIGTPGRTGHDYGDYWLPSGDLFWFGKKNSHIHQNTIVNMIDSMTHVHFFTRDDSRCVYFTYQGVGKCNKVYDTVPVQVEWSFPHLHA